MSVMWAKISIVSIIGRIFRSSLWIVTLALFTTGCSALSYFAYWISPDYPKDKTVTLNLPKLQATVRVYFDDLGVPHIEAGNELDLVRAVGFLHGRARFFQMDILRRYVPDESVEGPGESAEG